MSELLGAAAALRTLVSGGVDVCFTNPGTSEMHLIASLDAEPRMRGVLCLFEGVATGAADGFGRMSDTPASTLLHLGPGLGNGLANLHNARRAGTPIVNVIGDHATYHSVFDAPLESDIAGMAATVSQWVRRTEKPEDVGSDVAEAIAAAGTAAAGTGGVATLILPADVCWSSGAATGMLRRNPPPAAVDDSIRVAAEHLRRSKSCTLLLGGNAVRRVGLEAANRIATATGARVLAESSPARHERGAGIPHVERLGYLREKAAGQLGETQHLLLAGAAVPVTFFAYPGQPSGLIDADCTVTDLAGLVALEALADLVAPDVRPEGAEAARPGMPSGALTSEKAAAVVGALLPEGAIVSDEAVTSGWWLPSATSGCPPHDWLTLVGGAIGQGMPLATGAAVACPDRPVISLQADGSGMYTLQALWTQARESLNVTTVLFNNGSYAILGMELRRAVGSARPVSFDVMEPASKKVGGKSEKFLDIPGLNFVEMARGMGVSAVRVETAEDLYRCLRHALAEPGPHLIEAMVPPLKSFII